MRKDTLELAFPPQLGNPLPPGSRRCLQDSQIWRFIIKKNPDAGNPRLLIIDYWFLPPLTAMIALKWALVFLYLTFVPHPKIWLIMSTFELKLSRLFLVSKSRSSTARISEVEQPWRLFWGTHCSRKIHQIKTMKHPRGHSPLLWEHPTDHDLA